MLTFIVPVKSKKISSSWEHFSTLFERTLKSISNQTSDQFRVVVVCHEKPNTDFEHPKIEYLHVDFDPPLQDPENEPKHHNLREEDKARKILAALEYIKKYDQDYVMVADADDCISNKIAAYVDAHKSENIPGWYFKKGYVYREGDKYISLNKGNFHCICGTCIIVKTELVEHIIIKRPELFYQHNTIKLTESDVLTPFPLPGAIYSMDNGDNHYMSRTMLKSRIRTSKPFSLSMVKGIFRKLKKYRVKTLNSRLKKEFGIYSIGSKATEKASSAAQK